MPIQSTRVGQKVLPPPLQNYMEASVRLLPPMKKQKQNNNKKENKTK